MCTIDKIMIRGIRSFNPDLPGNIEFFKPLTLIVGHNGAGKTTIIECLKQACTGELPPNTRAGQSFIHDPKVAGEMEVKAQIKLRINTASGQPVTITRSFQLTQKKQQLQFKTIDQTVQTIDKDGKSQSLSYRCLEMDKTVPSVMGVSKAVLENVIFVHQEDSNWPLSEGQVLKRKFDDIFAATKYTKALEALRKLRIEKQHELREFRLKQEHLRTHRDAAGKLGGDIKAGKQKQADLEKQIADLQVQIDEQDQIVAQLGQILGSHSQKNHSVKAQQEMLNSAIARNAERRVQLAAAYGEDELEYDLEELEEFLKSLSPSLEEVSRIMDSLAQGITAGESREEALKRQLVQEQSREAHLTAQADAHRVNITERNQALNAAAETAEMEALPSGPLTPNIVQNFMGAFGKKLEAEEEKLQQQRWKDQQQDDESSRLVDEVNGQITDATQSAKLRQQTLRENRAKIDGLQHQIETSGVSSLMAKDAADAESAAQQRLEQRQEALNQQNFTQELDATRSALEAIQSKISSLRQERDRLSVAADDGARLTVLRRERNQKQAQADTILNHRRQQISQLLGGPSEGALEPSGLKSSVEKLIGETGSQLQERSSALQQAQAQASSTQGALASCNRNLAQQQQEADALKSKITSTLATLNEKNAQTSQLDGLVSEEEALITKKRQKIERVNTLKINSKTWINIAQQQNCCELCQRPFHGNEKEDFLHHMDRRMSDVPNKLKELKDEIGIRDKKLSELKHLQPDWARLNHLQSFTIPKTTEEQQRLEAESSTEASQAAKLHEEVQSLRSRDQDLQDLRTEVIWPIDRLHSEIMQLSKEIARLENQMKISGSMRTVADVDLDLEGLEAERSDKERSRDDILRRQSKLRDEISHLQSSWYAAKEEATNLRNAANKQEGLSQELTALKQANDQLKQQIDAANRSISPLRIKREQLTRARQEKREAARERVQEIESRVRELSTLQSKLEDKCRVVSSYESSGKAAQLHQMKQTLQKTAQSISDQTAKLKELREQHQEKDRQLAMDQQNKRQIEELINLRRAIAEQEALALKIAELQAEIGEVGDLDDITHNHEQAQVRMKAFMRDQNMAQGSLATVKESIDKAQIDLSASQYENINRRFFQQIVETRTTEMAVGDLEKYHKALEKALLLFHTNKMADINKIIKELWQKTYRGQDIDYIQIKADADGARSYNYRVVMQAGGAELDMRGRCSAGQKVLACLIIRLALAETFCLNCGILALDEPTTNLDSANSASLAEALRNIMETRRSQDNFQLVIITHDESFAQLIGTREHAETKYRITKDDNQRSCVIRESIDE